MAKFPQKTPELIGAAKQKIFDAAINIVWRPTESVAQAGWDDSLGLSRFDTYAKSDKRNELNIIPSDIEWIPPSYAEVYNSINYYWKWTFKMLQEQSLF